jgi:hypothetical protein
MEEKKMEVENLNQSQFLYVGGGMNPLPTVYVGYRTFYSSMGSDVAISGSLAPAIMGSTTVIPGLVYKHLFFKQDNWKDLKTGKTAFYIGPQIGVYPFDSFNYVAVNGGAVLGWQFKKKHRSDFFEIGINPILYDGEELQAFPLGGVTYGFMF